ncbi:MAG: acyl carrier protein [Sedimenticola sp.]
MSDKIEMLKEFMESELNIETSDLEIDTPLFSSGVIDSFSLVSLLSFVESTFNFRVGPTDVNLANFDSLGRMLAYIENRGGA